MQVRLQILVTALSCVTGCDRSRNVTVDGSSTVFSITEAVAEEFRKIGDVRVAIGVSGTSGGFIRLCGGEVGIIGASRPVAPHELRACDDASIELVELPIAYDGLAVVVHPSNHWVDDVTVTELKAMWAPESQDVVRRWSDLRPGWPDTEFHLYGPGIASGTYDCFTREIVGRERASRGDFHASEDDHTLVQGVASDPLALGFFGYGYYAANHERLKLVAVDDGQADNGVGPIAPSPTTIVDGTYQPLTRPIFVYVAKRATDEPEVAAFLDFYLERAPELIAEVGYVPLSANAYDLVRARLARRATGSIFDRNRPDFALDVLLDASARW